MSRSSQVPWPGLPHPVRPGRCGRTPIGRRAHELAIACGDKEAELKAVMALAHVLVWSVSTDRASDSARGSISLLAGPERAHEHRRALVPGHDRAVGRARCWRPNTPSRYGESASNTTWSLRSVPSGALVAAHQAISSKPASSRGAAVSSRGNRAPSSAGSRRSRVPSICGTGNPSARGSVVRRRRGARRLGRVARAEPALVAGRLCRGALELDRADDAVLLLDGEEDAVRVGRAWVLAHIARCRGLIAAARGDVDEALGALDAAVAKHEAVDDSFGGARALLALGVVRRRARQSGRRERRSSRRWPALRRSVPWVGPKGARRARSDRRPPASRGPHGCRAARRGARRRRANEPRGRGGTLPRRTDRCQSSHTRLRQAGVRSRTELARKLRASDVALEGVAGGRSSR